MSLPFCHVFTKYTFSYNNRQYKIYAILTAM